MLWVCFSEVFIRLMLVSVRNRKIFGMVVIYYVFMMYFCLFEMMLLKVGVGGCILRLRKFSMFLKIIIWVMFRIVIKVIGGSISGKSSVNMMWKLVVFSIIVLCIYFFLCLVMMLDRMMWV